MSGRGPRGSMADVLIVRLGDEGVPINVIARATLRDPLHVRGILLNAKADGLLGDLPAEDWPGDGGHGRAVPDEIDWPLLDRTAMRIQVKLGFTRAQARFVAALLLHETVARPTMRRAAAHTAGTTGKLLDVVAHQVRAALKPLGLEFRTLWGSGFAMDGGDAERLRGLVGMAAAAGREGGRDAAA